MAFFFGLLGFLLHAYCCGKAELAESLERKAEGLRQALEDKEREACEFKEAAESTAARMASLNRQIDALRLKTKRRGPQRGPQERAVPLWRDNLNNLLAMLDKIEKNPD